MSRFRLPHLIVLVTATVAPLLGQATEPVKPNYEQAERYSSDYLRQRTYSTSVQPNWIGETDRFWYSYRSSTGTQYKIVDPVGRVVEPLFDHQWLASKLSQEARKPVDTLGLSLSSAKVDDEGKSLSFQFEKTKFELDLATGVLENLGAVEQRQGSGDEPPSRRGGQQRGNSQRGQEEEEEKDPRAHRNFSPDRTAYVFLQDHDMYFVEASDEVKAQIAEIEIRLKAEKEAEEAAKEAEKLKGEKEGDTEKQDKKDDEKKDDEKKDGEKKDGEKKDGEKKDEGDASDETDEGEEEEEDKVDERERWADEIDETKAVRLTEDGEEDYEFSSRSRSRRGAEFDWDEDAYLEGLQAGEIEDPWSQGGEDLEWGPLDDEDDEDGEDEPDKRRPSVSWAQDSTAFHATRRDSRDVGELFLVNSLSMPRPTLETYNYPLPGEERITTSELHVFDRTRKELFRVEGKWKDEGYSNVHWTRAVPPNDEDDDEEEAEPDFTGTGDELRMRRQDRLLRNMELCAIDTRTGATRVLIEEGLEGANLSPQSVRYLRDRDEFIWWSVRNGWGHYYLYGMDGTFKNAITAGQFRASRIVEVDEEKGLLYFQGNAREQGENVYYQHLYRVFLDGTGLTLMDPGNANHRSVLSPTQAYAVDNCSRIDMAPQSRLCDADGNVVMTLEEADLSRLHEAGWRMPETFTFKAADGITDLYGNMWKPFDFDPGKRYPIIAEVYPGPQTEGVSHGFTSSNGRQQLAQIGFIVVQLGHRGGTPGRSKAYHSYGYNNLRDYGLADKKAGIEQLAERHAFIDIDRVGLYGHSGGGFMTAAALMQEPYNDFFKVGVSSSGNHDNNVYGRHWGERYHGLKQIEVKKEKADKKGDKTGDKEVAVEAEAQDTKKGKQTDKVDGDKKQDGDDTKKGDEVEDEVEIKWEIHVPTNAELAANLKGHLLLVHGDMDNNVHPAGTMRLVDALIKANKRFDMLIIPGKRHGYGNYNSYFTKRKWEFFAEHLLGDHQSSADIEERD